MLTSETFEGIYAGLPVPWDEKGNIDEGPYTEAMERLVSYGVQGIYNGGSTGEFFAQDYELFCRTTDLLIETLAGTPAKTQVGVLALTTEEVIKRGKYAIKKGVDALQVSFPWWYQLTDEEAVTFYRDLHEAFDGFPLIHYNISRAKKSFGLGDIEAFKRVYEAAPSIIGFKAMADVNMLLAYNKTFPDIQFFSAAPHWFTTFHSLGLLQGLFDAMVYMNPRIITTIWNFCKEGNYEEALPLQAKLQHYFMFVIESGLLNYSDAAIDKTMGISAGFLKGYTNRVKAPYRTPPESILAYIRGRIEKELPELLEY